ncbi:Transcription factor WER [Tritrichomonas foetus]|uniref:Transcription factor WER n=1 Tax=Tritrichomonas foetus TaxID=1144522 RepID=A0A1J4KUQ4_9EUKA|nr:Transcription factor WER [Tritrichomonas foetus]|eukprot:OHT13492.1 Transcription factor WER [Tritrichomonas foetus]
MYQNCRNTQKMKFTPDEDDLLRSAVNKLGTKDWTRIAKYMISTGRSARQCRDRWINYLAPGVVNGNWTEEEEELLVQKQKELGRSWKKIAFFFPSRTEINIKCRWLKRERRLKKLEKLRIKVERTTKSIKNQEMLKKSSNHKNCKTDSQVVDSQGVHSNDVLNTLMDKKDYIHDFLEETFDINDWPFLLLNEEKDLNAFEFFDFY